MSKAIFLTVGLFCVGFNAGADAFSSAFPNGVAAGEVTRTSAVIWTRSGETGTLTFELSSNAEFDPLDYATTIEVLEPMQPVKFDFALIDGLWAMTPGTQYFYRFRNANGESVIGTFRTPPQAGALEGLRFGVSGDWRGELAPYPSVSNVVARNLDFFVGLGDTVYADIPSPAVPGGPAQTLEEFRAKHNEVYSARFGQNILAELRASTAFFATIDDHEIANDFAGGAKVGSDSRFGTDDGLINESTLFATGIQAFEEYNPIRPSRYETPEDPRMHERAKFYRAQQYGDDAVILILDARSFRDRELAGVANPLDSAEIDRFNALSFDIDSVTGDPLPRRTMLGVAQLKDIKDDLLAAHESGVLWKFVMVPEPIQNLGAAQAQDRFDGYASERTELLQFIDEHWIRNVVFVSADIHGTVVNNLVYQLGPGEEQIPIPAFEVVTGSVAYDRPFGPTTFDEAAKVSVPIFGNLLSFLLTNVGVTDRAGFDALPLNERDSKYGEIMDFLLGVQGLDQTGLDGSGIDAELLAGGYVAVHSFGWTEFEIDTASHSLTVTTYGIEAYSVDEVDESIVNREPEIVSQFRVMPQGLPVVPPSLAAAIAGGMVAISWPADDGYVLQTTGGIDAVADWADVDSVPTVQDGQASVELELEGGSAFYRLIRRE